MKRFILPAILFLAFFLRVVAIDKIPVGFTPDEASFGYDAYSILHTGRDQWGNLLPIVLKSFGDYKSPLYAYLAVPSVAIFGLNVFATRLPNAIIGTFAVLAIYLLFKDIVERLKIDNSDRFAALSALLLAISPWAVMMSRGAFEANLITFFIPFGIYLFLEKKYSLSALFFGLSLFTYHSAKFISPIVLSGLVIVFREDLKKTGIKKLIFPLVVLLIFGFGMIYSQVIGGAGRINERIISQGALEDGAKAKIELIQKGTNPVLAKILHNKYQVVLNRFFTNYFQYFSIKFLFVNGPAETTYGMIPGVGVLYTLEGILLLGLIPAFFNKKIRNVIFLITIWLLIGPVPGALATGVGFSANRAEGMIPTLQILEAFGAVGWSFALRRFDRRLLSVVAFSFALFFAFEIQKTARIYFVGSPVVAGEGMLSGNLEAVDWLSHNLDSKKVIVSRRLSEPQIYVAFVNKWDPADYQNKARMWKVETWVDQIPEYELGNYVFKNIDWKAGSYLPNTLLVGRPDEFFLATSPLKIINYPDGKKAVLIVDGNQKLYASNN